MSSITDRQGNIVGDVSIKQPCRAATTANITLSGLQTVDGVVLAAGDRVLAWNQTDQTTNGIYAAQTGTWNRPNDASGNAAFFEGTKVFIAEGTTYTGRDFAVTCTDNPIVLGTSLLTWLAVGSGNASGPASATSGNMPKFADATGKVLSDSGKAAASVVTGPNATTSGHIAQYADTTGKTLQDGGALGTLAARNALLLGDFGASTVPASALAPDVVRTPQIGQVGTIGAENLFLANDGTNATRDIDIGAGRCEADDFASKLILAGTMVKRLDTLWAAGGKAGSPAGGCDSGGVKGNSQTLHIYLIGKPGLAPTQFSRTSNVASLTVAAHGLGVGGTILVQGIGSSIDATAVITVVPDVNTVQYANTGTDIGTTAAPAAATATGFDVLASRNDGNAYPSPSMPSGWTLKQCLGSVLTGGTGSVLAFSQLGDTFLLATSIANVTNSNPGDTNAHLLAMSVPLGVKVEVIGNFITNSGSAGYASSPDQADEAPGTSAKPASNYGAAVTGAINGMQLRIRTDTSGQIRYRLSSNTAQTIVSLGWRDPRRRLF